MSEDGGMNMLSYKRDHYCGLLDVDKRQGRDCRADNVHPCARISRVPFGSIADIGAV